MIITIKTRAGYLTTFPPSLCPKKKGVIALISLAQCKEGNQYRITKIQGTNCREQVLRMGFAEGATLSCISNIQRGPVVVRHMHTDVGIGRGMAEKIFVELCKAKPVSLRGETVHGIMSSGREFRHGERRRAQER